MYVVPDNGDKKRIRARTVQLTERILLEIDIRINEPTDGILQAFGDEPAPPGRHAARENPTSHFPHLLGHDVHWVVTQCVRIWAGDVQENLTRA